MITPLSGPPSARYDVKTAGCWSKNFWTNLESRIRSAFSSHNASRVIFNGTKPIIGSGIYAEKKIDLSSANIRVIECVGAGNLTVKQGDVNQLRISSDDNLIDHLSHSTSGKTLQLGITDISYQTNLPINFELTLKIPRIEAIRSSGAGRAEFWDLDTPNLSCDISGAGSVQIHSANRPIESQQISISGTGHYDASAISAKNTKVKISGVGSATVWTTNTLDVTLSGVGSCSYSGNPPVITGFNSGLGCLKKL